MSMPISSGELMVVNNMLYTIPLVYYSPLTRRVYWKTASRGSPRHSLDPQSAADIDDVR